MTSKDTECKADLHPKKKETVGSQIIEKVEKAIKQDDKGPEAREVTKEWGKKFLKDIENIINDPKYKEWEKIYVKVLAKKHVYTTEMVSVVYGITDVRPLPDWKNLLYLYDREKNRWTLEWVLPQSIEIARVILAHREGFDPFLVDCIEKFMAGKLPGQKIKNS